MGRVVVAPALAVFALAWSSSSGAPTTGPAAQEAALGRLSTSAPSGGYRGPLLAMTGDASRPVSVWDPDGEPVLSPYYALDRKGLALIGREYSLRLDGGCFYSGAAEEYLVGGLRRGGGELTLAAYVQPAAVSQPGGCIIGYGPARGDLLFALSQEKDALIFAINAGAPRTIALTTLKSADPFHLVLTVGKNEIVFYVNGKKAGAQPGLRGDFSAWPQGRVYFGNDASGVRPWRGVVERAALCNTALPPKEAEAAAEAVLRDVRERPVAARIELTGTLRSRSKYPNPWDRGFTYREVLCVCEYEVNEVIHGAYAEKTIRVTEWVYVDRLFLTNSRNGIGTKRRMVVEPLDANPQLSTIHRADTLPLDLDATVYYDVSPIEALPVDQQPKPKEGK